MTQSPLTDDQLQETVDLVARFGSISAAARFLCLSRNTFDSRYQQAKARNYRPRVEREPESSLEDEVAGRTTDTRIITELRKGAATLDELATRLNATRGQTLDLLDAAKESGLNITETAGKWAIEAAFVPAYVGGPTLEYVSRPDNTFVFGVTSDNHLGSKYERLDALEDAYNEFERAGVDRVFNSGNWIEGEAPFNRTEIHTFGMDAQMRYLAANYPKRSGLVTYAVTGNDHEGWYAKREGVDVGRYAERVMREAGRTDWVDLGFMEAHVKLTNANTGKSQILAVVHPGGGSAYADSYVVQKIIESLEGGEKPAVALYGHYHKCLAGEYRNVWWVLVPSTKDQDTFMRGKRIRSVVGAGIITLRQDPETGAIYRMLPDLWKYYNQSYYNNRWSHHGPVVLPKRSA